MSESYRWVRLGVGLLITGYALLVPLLIYWLFFSENAKGVPDFILLAALVTIFAALSLIVTGSILLRFAPHQDEKTAANKYLIAYGIAIGCAALSYWVGLAQLDLVRRIAAAYGSFYLVGFFPILAENRDNPALTYWANLTNQMFVVLIVAAIGGGLLAGFGVLPIFVLMIAMGIAASLFFIAWMQTLWQAFRATQPIQRDFETVPPG